MDGKTLYCCAYPYLVYICMFMCRTFITRECTEDFMDSTIRGGLHLKPLKFEHIFELS